ncbi:MAG: hypothetical protein MHM6MM_002310 [Cercozoa sp. M6MM]
MQSMEVEAASNPDRCAEKNSDVELEPERRVKLSFENVVVAVTRGRGENVVEKRILDGVSGVAVPGRVMAIMGPSGCGKTTLLDALAARISRRSVSELSGSICVNGARARRSVLKHVCAYVTQEDHLVGTQTVTEAFQFAANVQFPAETPEEEKQCRIEATLKQLGLWKSKDTRIGTVFMKGLSGGQQRRVSLGLELLRRPSLVLCDEPTSGLDAESALRVMQVLQSIARAGHTVVCTLHQPSSHVFQTVDDVMILTAGRLAYCGERARLAPFFAEAQLPVPELMNVADHALAVVNTDFAVEDMQMSTHDEEDKPVISETAKERVDRLVAYYASRKDEFQEHMREAPMEGEEHEGETFATSAMRQMWNLLKRQSADNARNPGVYWIRWLMYFMLSLMIGTFYVDIGNTQSEIQDRISALFYACAFLVFMAIAVMPQLITERSVFTKETSNGWYGAGPYVIAHSLSSIPGLLVISLTCSLLIYFPMGLSTERDGALQFFLFLLNLFLSLFAAEAFMHAVAAIVPFYIIGMALAAGFFGLMMLAEGFFVLPSNMPAFWKWAYYIALHTYSFETFMWNEFNGLTLEPCGADTPVCLAPSGSGNDVLSYYDMDVSGGKIAVNLIVMFCMALFYRLLAYAVLRYFRSGKR